ncbi:MAG: DUF3108 domain-containing protein [Acidobacteria bacterium]|nr:DUF3108 domain-containing protein [Acidobacteriota bacterium]
MRVAGAIWDTQKFMPGFDCRTCRLALLLAAAALSPVAAQPAPEPAAAGFLPRGETLSYGVEWRLIRAGAAKLIWDPAADNGARQVKLELQSAGLVNTLYRVRDSYLAAVAGAFCTSTVSVHAEEGGRRRDTRITFDRETGKSSYLEQDLVKNTVASRKEIDISPCTHDVITALFRLRTLRLPVGETMQFPVSDGKKFAQVRVVAQESEQVKTPAGKYQAIRYEVFLFNDILYRRKGRFFVWLTDDELRVPVQIRARLQFHIGTITFQLEKQERM